MYPFSDTHELVSDELYDCARELLNCYYNIILLYDLYNEVVPYPIQTSADKVKKISAILLTHSQIIKTLKHYERH